MQQELFGSQTLRTKFTALLRPSRWIKQELPCSSGRAVKKVKGDGQQGRRGRKKW